MWQHLGAINSQVKLLSFVFLIAFFGFNGIQQYVTTFFSEAGIARVGFWSLILIYMFFVLSNPLSAVLVSKYGAKKSMILALVFYSLFIFSLLSKSVTLIYTASALLGIAASFLWTGQNSYLIRASDGKSYGASAGLFSSFQSLGSALGVIVLGLLIAGLSFTLPFLAFAIFPLIGFCLLFKLKDIRGEGQLSHFRLLKKSITSKTALRFSVVWFSFMFVYGLIIGIIPIEIKNTVGVSYVGVISSLFYIMPILLAYIFGKFSDIKGRKPMLVFAYLLAVIGLLVLYFSGGEATLLVLGVILLALNFAIIRPVTMALVGDVSTKDNLEFLTALFWMAQNVGVVSALVISGLLLTSAVYLISIFIMAASLLVLSPLLRLKTEKIKEMISQEVS